MFEALIKRILLALFGKFIDGIDKNQIQFGVMSGNLVIEGVSIKKEALDQLELPIQLVYSSIQRIQIVVPWNKLSTARTEIRVKNVFLLVTTKDRQYWNFKDINSFEKKIAQVEQNIKKAIEEEIKNKNIMKDQQMQQQEPEAKDLGYVQKLITRIVDNLYVSIQNVHFRYEHNISKHNFSWGITIHKIEQQSVENDWKTPSIKDRFDQKAELKSGNYINKCIQLEKLALYWNSDDHLLFSTHEKDREQYIQQKMQQELVFEPDLSNQQSSTQNQARFRFSKSSKYIFCLNAMAKVVQAYYHHYKVPEYKVNVELHEMDFKIKHTQYQEIVKLLQLFNEYQYKVKIARDLFKVTAIKPDKANYQNKPIGLYYVNYIQYLVNRIIQDQKRKTFIEYQLAAMSKKTKPQKLYKGKQFLDNQRRYQQIVLKYSIETLQLWTQTAIEINAKGHSKGIFHEFSQARQKQEDENLRLAIDKAFKIHQPSDVDMESYIYLEFQLYIAKGSLKLMRKHKNLEEGFTLIWSKFDCSLKKRQNNFEIEQAIQDLEVQMFSVEEKNDIIVPIVKKIRTYECQDRPLIYVKLEKHPLFKPNYFSSFSLDVQQIEIMLFIASMRRIIAYFRVPPTEERPPQRIDLKKATKDVNNMLEESTKNEIKITIQSPIVVIPNKQINDLNSDCWVLKLGDLDIRTVEPQQEALQKSVFQKMVSKLHHDSSPRRSVAQPMVALSVTPSINILEQSKKGRFLLEQSHVEQRNSNSSNNNEIQHRFDRMKERQKSSINYYDSYVMRLDSVQLQYFSSIHFFYNYQKLANNPKGQELLNHKLRVQSVKLDIIDQFSITLNLSFLKQLGATLPNKPQTKIEFKLPLLRCTLTPLVPHTLQKLSETIQNFSKDQTLSSILQQEKQKLLKYSTCKGYLRKRGTCWRSWTAYYVVLSGWYLYLYQNENDADFNQYIPLRDMQVSEAQVDIGVLHSFKIRQNQLKETYYFQAQNDKELKRWLKFIQQKYFDIKSKLNLASQAQNPIPQQVSQNKGAGDPRQSFVMNDSMNLLSKFKFNIQKVEIILKYAQGKDKDTVVAFEAIKLKSISRLQESYQQFSIRQIFIKEDLHYFLQSIQYSMPSTPANKQIVQQERRDKLNKKFEKMNQFISSRSFITKAAINFRIHQRDIGISTLTMLLLLSDLELHYKSQFVRKLSSFFQKQQMSNSGPPMSNQTTSRKDLESLAQLDGNSTNLQTQILYTQVPKQANSKEKISSKIFQEDANFTKYKNLYTIKSISESQGPGGTTDEIEETDQILIHLISQEIKIYMETIMGREFLQANIVKMSGNLKYNSDIFICDGSIKKIEIIDLISLKTPHIFLGQQSLQEKHRNKPKPPKGGLTIFSNKAIRDDGEGGALNLQMVEFKYSNFKNEAKIKNHIHTDIDLIVRDCFIDYLHMTVLKINTNLIDQSDKDSSKQMNSKQKLDLGDQEQDLEQMSIKLKNPVLQKVTITLQNPRIYLKPMKNGNQCVELHLKQISFDLDNSIEKNRLLGGYQKIGKKQDQVVMNLESIWCQNIVAKLDTMKILINSQSESIQLSNTFSAVLRLQQPLFIFEYETLFPNVVLDKSREIRLKVTSIQINLLRANFLFFMDIFQSQLMKKSQAGPQQQQKPSLQAQEKAEIKWMFQLDNLGLKLMDLNNDFSYYGTVKIPLVDFQMDLANILYQSNANGSQLIKFSVKDFKSHYYNYHKSHDEVYTKIQGVINALQLVKIRLDKFLDQFDHPQEHEEQFDCDKICSELKLEYYQEEALRPRQLFIEIKIDSEENKDIKIQFQESKILVNIFYLQIIQEFFALPQSEPQVIAENKAPASQRQEETSSLLKLTFNLNKSLILLQEESQNDLLTLQCELALDITESFEEAYHEAYHRINPSVPYSDEDVSKNTLMKLGVQNIQIYSAPMDRIIKLNLQDQKAFTLFRKKLILRPFALELVSQSFVCNCSPDHQQFITEDTIKFDKIRVNISFNDIILVLDTLNYQQNMMKQTKNAFKSSEEESINEDQINMTLQKPSMQASFVDVQRVESKKFSKLQNSVNNALRVMKSKSNLITDEMEMLLNCPEEQNQSISEVQSIVINEKQKNKRNPNKPVNYLIRRQVILESFEMVLINDLNKSYVPLLLFPLSFNQFLIEDNKLQQLVFGQVNLGLMCFNPLASKMEPIVEQTDFDLHIIQNREGYPRMQAAIEKREKEESQLKSAILNINVSAQIVLTLYRSLKMWEQRYQERIVASDMNDKNKGDNKHLNVVNKVDQRRVSSKLSQAFGSSRALMNMIGNQVTRENQDNVTLFNIVNRSGFYLKISRTGEDSENQSQLDQLDILNNEQKNYVIQSDTSDFANTFNQEIKLNIRFNDSSHKLYTISNIPIKSAVTKILPWQANDNLKYFVCWINIENLQKTINILSPYMLINYTCCTLLIKVHTKNFFKQIILEPEGQAAIPQEIYPESAQMTIQFQDKKYNRTSAASQEYNIQYLLEQKSIQIQHGSFFTQTYLNKLLVQGVTYIEFRSQALLYNLLPVPIQFYIYTDSNPQFQEQLLSHYTPYFPSIQRPIDFSRGNSLSAQNNIHLDSQPSMTDQNMARSQQIDLPEEPVFKVVEGMLEIVPQQCLQLGHSQMKDLISVQVRIPGYKLSGRFQLFNQTKSSVGLCTSVLLQDLTQQDLGPLHLHIERDFSSNEKKIFFYVQNCIINTTPYQLQYSTMQAGKVIKLAGQSQRTSDKISFEKSYSQIVVSNQIKHLMVSLEAKQQYVSNEVDISLLGSVGLQLKVRNEHTFQLYEFGIHISIGNNSLRKGIYTKVIEIMPRFVIVNRAQFPIYICQSGCEQNATKLIVGERIPLVWDDCRAQKAIRVMQAEPRGKYDWSGEIFISEIKSAHFFSPSSLEGESVLVKQNEFSFETQKSRLTEAKGLYKRFQMKKYDPELLQQHKKEQLVHLSASIQQSSIEFFRDASFLNAEITKNKATNYILIENLTENNYAYKIGNKCLSFNIIYSQDTFQCTREWQLQKEQLSPFAWEHPSHAQKLKIKFFHLQQQTILHEDIIDFQQHQNFREIIIKDEQRRYIIWLTSEFQGSTRLITISEVNNDFKSVTYKKQQELLLGMDVMKLFNVFLSSLGISIIMFRHKELVEANYIYLKHIEFGLLQTQQHTTTQLRVKFINIDNNTSINTTTPVLLTLQRCQQALSDPKYFFLEASLNQDQNVSAISLYHFIRLSIKPFVCQLDEEYVLCVLETVKYIQKQMEKGSEESFEYNGLLHSIKSLVFSPPDRRYQLLKLMSELDTVDPFLIWNSLEISQSKKLLYVQELILSTLNITFSFHKRFNTASTEQEENVFNLFSTAIGTTIQNINEASIILEAFRMRSIFDSQDIISQSVQDHYKSEIIKALLKIIGSIEIIGNPVRLIQQITNGLTDFVEMPIEGIKQGPLEFGMGIFRGTGSLLKNTVAGAFYSVNKVTGSISASVSLLSMDDQFLEERRINMLQRPNHIIEGLTQAGKSIYKGFSEGITGIVMQPYKETQKDGVKGFFKGTLKGLSGLVVKPIAGVLDASAKAAEGVVSTATHFDDKPNEKRIRYARVFYERQKYFTRYSDQDSRIMHFLMTYQDGRYSKIDYKESFEQKDSEQQLQIMQKRILQATKQIPDCFNECQRILVLSYQAVIIIDGLTMNVVQEINPKTIENGLVKEDNIYLIVAGQEVRLQIEVSEKQKVLETLKYLKEQVMNDY